MKTKMIVWSLAIMMVMPAPCQAQNDNKKSKKAEKAATIIGAAAVGGALIGGLFKKKKKDKEETNQEAAYVAEDAEIVYDASANNSGVEMTYVGEELQRREGAFKLVTNHPDFKIKVRRCEASGKTCVIDLIIEHVGSSDVKVMTGYGNGRLIAYDDEANRYESIKVSVGNSNWIWSEWRNLMSCVPMKARIQIEGVAESATMFRRLDWCIDCDAWGLGRNKPIKFMNLPISREGDE